MVKEIGATEFVFPSIIGSSSEGGTEMFPLKYFEKDAYLSQSCQLYKQMVACAMEKAFTIFTVWRAEKHSTVKHLNEARQLDFEMAFADEFVVMEILAKAVQFIVKKVLEEREEELEELGVDDLVVPEVKYFTFEEVKKILSEHDVSPEKYDLNTESEKKLGELYPNTLLMVHDWPYEGRGFYIMPKSGEGESKVTRGFDCIYKGMEITSGGQRVHIPELLEAQLKEKGLNPEHFKSYIDSFRYGAPPHGGFGLGLERLTMLILNLPNIRDVTLFPRDRERLTP
jgi:aspartyl-tRNA synthetase